MQMWEVEYYDRNGSPCKKTIYANDLYSARTIALSFGRVFMLTLVERRATDVVPYLLPIVVVAIFIVAALANWVWSKVTVYGTTDILPILITLLAFNFFCFFFELTKYIFCQSNAYKIVRDVTAIIFLTCLVFWLINLIYPWNNSGLAIIFIAPGSAILVSCHHYYKEYVQYKEERNLRQEQERLDEIREKKKQEQYRKEQEKERQKQELDEERKLRESQINLQELKAKMAAAHPDRGGTSEEFIAARKRYMEARRRQSKKNAATKDAPGSGVPNPI
jgi:hypothetical protein